MISQRSSIILALLLMAVVAVAFSSVQPIPQPETYHLFADTRSFLGIPNFGDVISNVPFAVIGICGLLFLLRSRPDQLKVCFADSRERWPYILVFFGIFLTAFGSAYYHLSPNNARLVWDRLPMTIGFAGMVGAIVVERISLRTVWLLPVLQLIGMGSVMQWYLSELRGAGDLRFYAAVQTYSALVLLLALLFPKRYTRNADLAVVCGFYALAKALESADKSIFAFGHIVSGHTLKHLAAAAAAYWILRMLRKRKPLVVQLALPLAEVK